MKINALKLNERDNVVTCVKAVSAGEDVIWRTGEAFRSLRAEEDIPFCHKIALTDIAAGEEVIKYGEPIGVACEKIPAGHWASHLNIRSVPRDYESEKV